MSAKRMYKQVRRRCVKGEKDLQNNKCHEIPYETRAGHYMASLHWNGSQCGSIEFNRKVVCEDHFTEQ